MLILLIVVAILSVFAFIEWMVELCDLFSPLFPSEEEYRKQWKAELEELKKNGLEIPEV